MSRQQQCLPCVYVEHNPRIEMVTVASRALAAPPRPITPRTREAATPPSFRERCVWFNEWHREIRGLPRVIFGDTNNADQLLMKTGIGAG